MKNFNVGIKGVIKRSDGAVLLLKKSGGDSFWEFPCGRIDASETILETLHRELGEELPDIANIRNEKLISAHRLQKDISDNTSLVLLYYSVMADLPRKVQLSEEHSDFRWITDINQIDAETGTKEVIQLALDK